MSNRGRRNIQNWLYRLLKHYKHRAQKFYEQSPTKERREAWQEVVNWFDSILQGKQLMTSGAIGVLPSELKYKVRDLENQM